MRWVTMFKFLAGKTTTFKMKTLTVDKTGVHD